MDDSDLLPASLTRFTAQLKPGGNDDDELIAPGNAYAIARGSRRPPGLKFLRSPGRCFALSYQYLPIPWWDTPDLFLIEYPGLFTVSLTGHGLGELQDRFEEYRLSWIRQCDPALAASLPVAVTSIEIIRAYPSREEGKP